MAIEFPEFLSLDALKIIIPSAPLRDVLDYARLCASFSCQGKRQKRPRFRHFVISPFQHFGISPFRVLNTPNINYMYYKITYLEINGFVKYACTLVAI